MPEHTELHVPDAETFGRVTYRLPSWACEDQVQRQHATVRVSFPGKLTFPEGNPWAMYNAPPVDGTEYGPRDSFCDVEVGEGDTAMTYVIAVNTFGTLVRKLVASGQLVSVGEPLFEYDARPPHTREWLAEHDEANQATRRFHSLWFVLKGSVAQIFRWKLEHRRETPRDFVP